MRSGQDGMAGCNLPRFVLRPFSPQDKDTGWAVLVNAGNDRIADAVPTQFAVTAGLVSCNRQYAIQ